MTQCACKCLMLTEKDIALFQDDVGEWVKSQTMGVRYQMKMLCIKVFTQYDFKKWNALKMNEQPPPATENDFLRPFLKYMEDKMETQDWKEKEALL